MEIEDAIEKKEMLEAEIHGLLANYEEETGLAIVGVKLELVTLDDGSSNVMGVDVDVRLQA